MIPDIGFVPLSRLQAQKEQAVQTAPLNSSSLSFAQKSSVFVLQLYIIVWYSLQGLKLALRLDVVSALLIAPSFRGANKNQLQCTPSMDWWHLEFANENHLSVSVQTHCTLPHPTPISRRVDIFRCLTVVFSKQLIATKHGDPPLFSLQRLDLDDASSGRSGNFRSPAASLSILAVAVGNGTRSPWPRQTVVFSAGTSTETADQKVTNVCPRPPFNTLPAYGFRTTDASTYWVGALTLPYDPALFVPLEKTLKQNQNLQKLALRKQDNLVDYTRRQLCLRDSFYVILSAEVEISKRQEDTIHKIFLDPTGNHLLACLHGGETYYLHSTSTRPKRLLKWSGVVVEAVAFDAQRCSEVSCNQSTRHFVLYLGHDDGIQCGTMHYCRLIESMRIGGCRASADEVIVGLLSEDV